MINTDKILVAIDFKELTNTLLSYALWLCDVTNCKKITLFHIMEYTLTPPAYLMPYITKEKRKIKEKLTEIAYKLTSFQKEIETKVVFGRLIDSIKEVVQDSRSIVTIGFKTHISRPSTSERILKGLKTPTLILKNKEFEEISPSKIKIDKILCPVDFSQNSLRALQVAKELSKRCNAKLKTLHVVAEQKVKGIIEEPEEVKKYIEYLRQEAEDKFSEIDRAVEHEVLSGNPAEEILKELSKYNLVVIGSKGRSYAEAVIIGSVAEAVIKNAKIPVLLIP